MNEKKWYLRTQDETFGPETSERLIEWARMGRIQPGQEISDDNEIWQRVEDIPFLDMRFSIDIGDGNPRGPFNRAAAAALLASGRLPQTARMVETREPFPPETIDAAEGESVAPVMPQQGEPEVAAEEVVSRPLEAEHAPTEQKPSAEVPRVIEKIVEVPVEKIVEKIVEVPVEKIVEREVEKVVVDETRVHDLEELLAEERRHTTELQNRMDEAAKAAAAREADLRQQIQDLGQQVRAAGDRENESQRALKDAASREAKLSEQVKALEDELRRLPQAASEVADIQAAMYSVMTKEAEELRTMLEAEKSEAEAFRRRHQERADRLLERRRELLKRAGANIEDMTRKALIERPEDPRTVRLRKELEDLRRLGERKTFDYESKIRELSDKLSLQRAAEARLAAGAKDMTQLRLEAQELRERLQLREKELLAERQKCEELRQSQAANQQALMARLASLESPSIGTAQSLSTNQSREARMVKLPGWMRLKR